MQIGVVGENGLGLFVSGDRVGGIALVQIILPNSWTNRVGSPICIATSPTPSSERVTIPKPCDVTFTTVPNKGLPRGVEHSPTGTTITSSCCGTRRSARRSTSVCFCWRNLANSLSSSRMARGMGAASRASKCTCAIRIDSAIFGVMSLTSTPVSGDRHDAHSQWAKISFGHFARMGNGR